MSGDFIVGLAIGMGVGMIGAFLYSKRKSKQKKEPSSSDFARLLGAPDADTHTPPAENVVDSLRQNLRLKCMYDEKLVDRLIEAERKRHPEGTLETHLRAAIERWERDNR